MGKNCIHIDQIHTETPLTSGCEECLRAGYDWVHLRLCLTCGHVGCCDDSKNKHSTVHFQSTGHPVVESLEPGENWRWCYVDEILLPSGVDEAGAHAYVSENVMPDKVQSPPGPTNDGMLSARQPLPLVGEISANGHSRGMFKSICQRVRRCNKKNFELTLELAVEIAREGREGRRIGTLFTFGDADEVLMRSRPLILDPLAGHTEEARQIRDPNLRGTIKELAQLDGAFVVSDQGVVVSACRYLDAAASDVALPFGMASRHLALRSLKLPTPSLLLFPRVRW